jgi:hypothetical protein
MIRAKTSPVQPVTTARLWPVHVAVADAAYLGTTSISPPTSLTPLREPLDTFVRVRLVGMHREEGASAPHEVGACALRRSE